jgi:hypothetical protein
MIRALCSFLPAVQIAFCQSCRDLHERREKEKERKGPWSCLVVVLGSLYNTDSLTKQQQQPICPNGKSLEIIMYAVASSTSSSCLQQVLERERG